MKYILLLTMFSVGALACTEGEYRNKPSLQACTKGEWVSLFPGNPGLERAFALVLIQANDALLRVAALEKEVLELKAKLQWGDPCACLESAKTGVQQCTCRTTKPEKP